MNPNCQPPLSAMGVVGCVEFSNILVGLAAKRACAGASCALDGTIQHHTIPSGQTSWYYSIPSGQTTQYPAAIDQPL